MNNKKNHNKLILETVSAISPTPKCRCIGCMCPEKILVMILMIKVLMHMMATIIVMKIMIHDDDDDIYDDENDKTHC